MKELKIEYLFIKNGELMVYLNHDLKDGEFLTDEQINKLIDDYDGEVYDYDEFYREVLRPIRQKEYRDAFMARHDSIIEAGYRQKKKGVYESDKYILKRSKSQEYVDKEEESIESLAYKEAKRVFGEDLKDVRYIGGIYKVRLYRGIVNFDLIEK